MSRAPASRRFSFLPKKANTNVVVQVFAEQVWLDIASNLFALLNPCLPAMLFGFR